MIIRSFFFFVFFFSHKAGSRHNQGPAVSSRGNKRKYNLLRTRTPQNCSGSSRHSDEKLHTIYWIYSYGLLANRNNPVQAPVDVSHKVPCCLSPLDVSQVV